ncbi:MAG: glycoside hydrolase family 99-like domain-containing protein [Gammaproteobacteria bacterium]|nr:glycoside hydrolase family 99-like domain-containing protein [Gammaproteobacteria bacterium]
MTKLISFYLPQYHPIPENNEWWGEGFTEWVNVSQTKPRFKGHHQPHIPADLGFYDLRLAEVRQAQAALAKEYGVSGFCYYHYWFNGKILLDRPFREVLSSGSPDFPFCLCWANENWTRAWDGLEREVLMRQEYSNEDSLAHIKWLVDAFRDERYIRVNGKPIVLIYRLDTIPDVSVMISLWRDVAKKEGFQDIYICAVKNGFVEMSDQAILAAGFDAIVDFQPNRQDFPKPKGLKSWAYHLAKKFFPDVIYQKLKLSISANNRVNYKNMVEIQKAKPWPDSYRKFPCVFPSWDNSARRSSATIIQNDDPVVYQEWLADAISKVESYPESEEFVFINAWNEWAEGCHLEPDNVHGRGFLEATSLASSGSK